MKFVEEEPSRAEYGRGKKSSTSNHPMEFYVVNYVGTVYILHKYNAVQKSGSCLQTLIMEG